MTDTVEKQLKSFYDRSGWKSDNEGQTLDAKLWEDLRPCARDYVSRCRLRLLPYLKKGGAKIMDAASGPVQYPEYLEYSKNFEKRVCVDISKEALLGAQKKLGDRGEYFCCSILELPFLENTMDAVVSLHTIYHIDESLQEKAVSELIRVAKPGAPILIVYSNPTPWYVRLGSYFSFFSRVARGLKRRLYKVLPYKNSADDKPVYFYPQRREWWNRFRQSCELEIVSWRFMTAEQSKKWIPDNALGKAIFSLIETFEKTFPKLASQWCIYPMIVLRKK